jgi:small-conductance mechanosensitive channel
MFSAFGFILKLVVWSVILLLVLDNLGVNITTLVAGLGVGGIAIALAVQNVLGDLFASLSIVLDKPFVIGDFIIVDNFLGSIEHIGLKTTRVRSLSGEQLIFANSDLLQSRIRNFKRMYERRVVFSLTVIYQTPYEKLIKIPQIVREIIESKESVRFDRAHFKEYGNSSLNFEIVYWVLSPDYNKYMDIQQAINLDIFRTFEAEGIEFAYPTQTLYIEKNGDKIEQASGEK